ncbi:hypothetical protein ACF1BP_33530 [Streptomyces sp. NPDC014735]|uniref:hypothetical protein n=1 Tax=unclassified Streptomyces TaxID=2593676 RepID=UPI0036F5EC3C
MVVAVCRHRATSSAVMGCEAVPHGCSEPELYARFRGAWAGQTWNRRCSVAVQGLVLSWEAPGSGALVADHAVDGSVDSGEEAGDGDAVVGGQKVGVDQRPRRVPDGLWLIEVWARMLWTVRPNRWHRQGL